MKLSSLYILLLILAAVPALAATLPCAKAKPEDPKTTKATSASQISAILKTVPAPAGGQNLDERLAGLGIRAAQITYGPVTLDEVCMSNGMLKMGDVFYQISTSAPSEAVTQLCPIAGNYTLVKRGRRWMPQDRTGNYLIKGICKAPGIYK